MKPRLLKSSQLGEFVPFPYSGVNESGYEPIGDRVLVGPDSASDTTSGGVALTADHVDRTTRAAETGVIVACGSDAFHWTADKLRPIQGEKPKPGDRVYVERYSGQTLLGEDGRFYRLMECRNVGAVKTAPESELESMLRVNELLRKNAAKGAGIVSEVQK